MTHEDVIIAPILSEKSTVLKEQGVYVFRVSPRANKIQIKRAVAALFSVTVTSCRIIVMKGKPKRIRYRRGYTSQWKKAIVSLKQGESISAFEGA